MNKKIVNRASNGKALKNNSGIANAFDMFSSNQFSIFRLARSHIPAHPVALTQASHAGTSESVREERKKNRIRNPPNTMLKVMIHSVRDEKDTRTGFWPFFLDQYHQPYTLITK